MVVNEIRIHDNIFFASRKMHVHFAAALVFLLMKGFPFVCINRILLSFYEKKINRVTWPDTD